MSESEVIFRSTLKRLDQSQARLDELTPGPTNVVLGATLQPEDMTGREGRSKLAKWHRAKSERDSAWRSLRELADALKPREE